MNPPPPEAAAEITRSHRETLARFRHIIIRLLGRLEEDMQQPQQPEDTTREFWWGSRESAVSVVVKLAQVFLKVMQAEQKLMAGEDIPEDDALTENDMEILQRYVEKITQHQSED